MDWGQGIGNELVTLVHVALAMGLGALIGLDRESADKPAGVRTLALIAGGSALLVGLADPLIFNFVQEGYSDDLRIDPIRIFEAAVTALAFLGAGTIIQRGGKEGVEGLTSAASVLLVGGIGIAAALQQYVLCVGGTGLTLIVLRCARWWSRPGSGG